MSAVKIILKRSSVLGKRPNSQLLEAGELGLNTNSTEPGLFFEVTDGTIVKAGPTSYLPEPPTTAPARGELWVDSDTKTLNIGTQDFEWQKIAAPWLGGTNGYAVFVAPDYPSSSDSLNNDGQAVPFKSINRAIIQIGRQIVLNELSFSATENRFTIFLAPGYQTAINGPGTPLGSFNVDFSASTTQTLPSQAALQQFNSETGGIILPAGVSIIGMDLKKTEVSPTYVPKYLHPSFPADYTTEPNGPIITNQPLSNIFKWSGNSYVSDFTVRDKILQSQVFSVTASLSGEAIFTTQTAHGLGLDDFIQLTESKFVVSTNATNINGQYYVDPLDTFSFKLSKTPFNNINPQVVFISNLPTGITSQSGQFLYEVVNIYPYFSPLRDVTTGAILEPYEYSNYSSHRLSAFGNASVTELNEFYAKIQRAFPDIFGGLVQESLAQPAEYEIVAPTSGVYPNNLDSNGTRNSSPYLNQITVRSEYGMAALDADGDKVSGFKSVIANAATSVSLQTDPAGYQIYSTDVNVQNWVNLTALTAQQQGVQITNVRTKPQLQLLNQTSIPNIRYYYQTLQVKDPQSDQLYSTGLTDIDNDFRHYGFRVRGANTYVQAQSVYTIGAAIGCWAKDGAIMSLTNSTSNFGSVAFQSEGFAGIGTLGGANPVNQGFLHAGVVRPLGLLDTQATDDSQKRILYLGSRITAALIDPEDTNTQLLYLAAPLDPASLLPFSLNPGSAVFVIDSNCTYRGFFATDGQETAILTTDTGGSILRVRATDSTIPNQVFGTLAIPYIRRFIDPRQDTEKAYGFFIQSTNPTSQAPQVGSVLRLNQTGQQLSQALTRNKQFDPGQYGGIQQVFTVDNVQTSAFAASANYNNKISDRTQGASYSVYASLTDNAIPWIQNATIPPYGVVGFNTAAGAYTTFENRNYYTAENNAWQQLYYRSNYSPINGPIKANPADTSSPLVTSNTLLTQEPVNTAWQGSVPDYFLGTYDTVPQSTYFRGATYPYSEIYGEYFFDDDDSSTSLGMIYTRQATTAVTTLVSDTVVVQTALDPTVWDPTSPPADPTFGRPQIDEINLLSVGNVVNPRQEISILRFSNQTETRVEYVRVISLTSNTALVIRNYYPTYAITPAGANVLDPWLIATRVTICTQTNYVEPVTYDPDWSITKTTIFRYYLLMGYSYTQIRPYLTPQYSGERVLLNSTISVSPVDGYAQQTTSWPVEFNNASTIIASMHNWQYCGYLDYSRGLPKYQVNEIDRKLSFDFLSTSTWSGRLTVAGTVDNSNIVFLGTLREAVTGNYYANNTPAVNTANRQIYASPAVVQFPDQISVYTTDNIADQFDGVATTFRLQRGGFDIPPSQLLAQSVIVNLGAVTQTPNVAYTIVNNDLVFSEAPLRKATCDVRVVTSDDNETTLVAVPLAINETFNGLRAAFTITIPEEYRNLVINSLNTFIFFGGTEQIPGGEFAYVLNRTDNATISVVFTEAPSPNVTTDIRAFCTGYSFSSQGQFPVQMYSLDDIANSFDASQTVFPLRYNGSLVNPSIISTQNVFVSLGGAMQIPTTAYTVFGSTIIFSEAPGISASCNIRLVTNAEFIPCTVNGLSTNVTFGLPIV